MEIMNLRPSGAGLTFDVQLSPGVMLRDWTLRRANAGWRAYQPRPRTGRSAIWLAPAILNELTRQAADKLEGFAPHDHHHTA